MRITEMNTKYRAKHIQINEHEKMKKNNFEKTNPKKQNLHISNTN